MLNLDRNSVGLVVVDVQEKLFPVIHQKEYLLNNISKLIKCLSLFDIPMMLTEQYNRFLGPTIDSVIKLMPELRPVHKMSFNCCFEPDFLDSLNNIGKQNIIIAGIETHICVLQTAMTLKEKGFDVYLAGDACGTRDLNNHKTASDMMRQFDIFIASSEMLIFQVLHSANDSKYGNVMKIIKN